MACQRPIGAPELILRLHEELSEAAHERFDALPADEAVPDGTPTAF